MHAGRVVVAGRAEGRVIVLDEPLSFWGGFDPIEGRIIDAHHPQRGLRLTGAVVVMTEGRGSSSASSVIAEAARLATAPAALIVLRSDEILSTGAIVADELYGRPLPIVEVDEATFARCQQAAAIELSDDGGLELH